MSDESIPSKEIIEIAKDCGVARGGLHAEISLAESGQPLNREAALAAMRALNIILRRAEGVI